MATTHLLLIQVLFKLNDSFFFTILSSIKIVMQSAQGKDLCTCHDQLLAALFYYILNYGVYWNKALLTICRRFLNRLNTRTDALGCRPFSTENCPPDSFPGVPNPRPDETSATDGHRLFALHFSDGDGSKHRFSSCRHSLPNPFRNGAVQQAAPFSYPCKHFVPLEKHNIFVL